MSSSPFLTVAGLCVQYGQSRALQEFSMELESGEWLAVFGPNGSGKSTLLKAISGVLPRFRNRMSGQILLRGSTVFEMDQRSRAMQIAYVGADLRAEFPLKAWEAVALARICHSTETLRRLRPEESGVIEQAMRDCLCWDFKDREISSLSGGERQLVLLARALAQGAKLLLLDETFSKMDLNHQAAMGALLKKQTRDGKAIMMVSHDVNLASEWADSCVILSQGERRASGKMSDTLIEENLRKIYPRTALTVGRNPVTGAPKVFFGSSAAE